MTIMQLKYFLAVCEFGTLRIASEHLHVSEPAISVSIKRLEDSLGAPLFIRDRKRMTLTETGKRLQENAVEVVASFDRLEEKMAQSRQKSQVIRLGVPTSLGEYLYSRFILEFTGENPSALFELVPFSSREAVRQLEDGKIELAVCNQLAITSDQLEFIPLFRSPLVGCVCSDHPLAGKEKVTPQMLKNEKLILTNEKAPITQETLRWFCDAGIEPNIFAYSTLVSFTTSIVSRHNAVTFLLDALFQSGHASALQGPGFRSFTLDPPLVFTNGVARRKDVKLSKEAARFYEFCRHYASEPGRTAVL